MKAKRIDRVLVTGGLGFIGRYTIDLLAEREYEVNILDKMEPQAHHWNRRSSKMGRPSSTVIIGDVRKREDVERALDGVDAVIHLAASVGVGQSMYEVERYVDNNTRGTATLLNAVIDRNPSIRKLVVASSMSVYGEGKYVCEVCGPAYPSDRTEDQLRDRQWEPNCPTCGRVLTAAATSEDRVLLPSSIYAQSKRHQEEMCLLIGRTYGIPTIALRYFSVYGPGQSLSNPYTGVCALFASRILNKKPPYLFEDGAQLRDFVSVFDVAQANLLALEKNEAGKAINVGSGTPSSIKDVARRLIGVLGARTRPYISGRYRKGDIRHCFADITLARDLLDYKPRITLEEGFKHFAAWAVKNIAIAQDRSKMALDELREKSLAI